MGEEAFGRHRQTKRSDIALAPDSMDRRIAARKVKRDRLAIDRNCRAFRPAGKAQLPIEGRRSFGVDRNPDVAGPRIVAGLADSDLLIADRDRGFNAAVEVDGEAVSARRQKVPAGGRNEARDIHGAAGADVPGPAPVLAPAL